MKFRQHIPGYFSGFEPFEVEAKTTQELLENEWIKKWSKHAGFYRYSYTKYPGFESYIGHLMCEREDGFKWTVLGYVTEPLDLPIWEAKYKKDEDGE